jgi:hypothetical protein
MIRPKAGLYSSSPELQARVSVLLSQNCCIVLCWRISIVADCPTVSFAYANVFLATARFVNKGLRDQLN